MSIFVLIILCVFTVLAIITAIAAIEDKEKTISFFIVLSLLGILAVVFQCFNL